jgi:CRISPR/Cas system-associated protein endoribonuclease Cas2
MGTTLLIRLFFRQELLHFLQNSKAHPQFRVSGLQQAGYYMLFFPLYQRIPGAVTWVQLS